MVKYDVTVTNAKNIYILAPKLLFWTPGVLHRLKNTR